MSLSSILPKDGGLKAEPLDRRRVEMLKGSKEYENEHVIAYLNRGGPIGAKFGVLPLRGEPTSEIAIDRFPFSD